MIRRRAAGDRLKIASQSSHFVIFDKPLRKGGRDHQWLGIAANSIVGLGIRANLERKGKAILTKMTKDF